MIRYPTFLEIIKIESLRQVIEASQPKTSAVVVKPFSALTSSTTTVRSGGSSSSEVVSSTTKRMAKMARLNAVVNSNAHKVNSSNVVGNHAPSAANTTPREEDIPLPDWVIRKIGEQVAARRASRRASAAEAEEHYHRIFSSSVVSTHHPPDLFSDEDRVIHNFGMGCFASPEVKGFHGIFRQRWRDFYVTEVEENGQLVSRVPDFSTPSIPNSFLHSKGFADDGVNNASYRGAQDAEGDHADDTQPSSPSSIFDLDVEKQRERSLSLLLDKKEKIVSQKILTQEAIAHHDDDDIQSKSADNNTSSTSSSEVYVQCILHKQHVAHFSALSLLSQVLRIHPSAISVAGIKDLIGDTVQRIRIRGVSPASLLQASRRFSHTQHEAKGLSSSSNDNGGRRSRNGLASDSSITLHSFSYHREPLRPGDLFGNHFRIVLRDVSASQDEVDVAMRNFESKGFPNYYGCQRFSWFGGKDDVAFAMLHHNWLAVAFRLLNYTERSRSLRELLQRPKKYPNPIQDQYRRNAVRRLRACSLGPMDLDQPLFSSAPKLFESFTNAGTSSDLNAKQHLVMQCLRDAFFDLEFSSRRMTGQRLQSFLWNQVLSLRLHYYGSEEVLEGDLVLPKEARLVDGARQVRLHDLITTVTPENKHRFTIEDVVHPAFQFEGVRLPDNEVGEFYRDVCRKYALDWNFRHVKRGMRDFVDPPRPIIRKPRELKWSLNANDKILNVEFTLERGCYANVAVSELLKLPRCAGSDKILILPAHDSLWEHGERDSGYVEAMQDVYEDFEGGYTEQNLVRRDEDNTEISAEDGERTSLFEWMESQEKALGKAPRLFHREEDDPANIAARWSRKNLKRNMHRRIDDAARLKQQLFEPALARTIGDDELANYAGHHVPKNPNVKSKSIFFKVKKRANRFAGAPKAALRLRRGAQVQRSVGHVGGKSAAAPFITLNKSTWNVTW